MTDVTEKNSATLREEALTELTRFILPFWMTRMTDNENGGFYGRIDGEDNVIADAPKGAILNARILWSFSAAYELIKDPACLANANRAWEYIVTHFFDKEHGGTYWCLSADGKPLDTKKQIYSQAFFIYAFSQYFIASGNKAAQEKAIELFRLIEKRSFDTRLNGYFEAYDRRWHLLDDLRLSEKDANEKKTMNTHLHVLEAYTTLYMVWPDPQLRQQLATLIKVFSERIVDPQTSHLNLFFDEEWNCRSTIVSYGHDIEASWLLCEAAEALGEAESVSGLALRIASAAHEGLAGDGSLFYEKDDAAGHFDRDRHWWVQSEAVVGFLNAWQLSGDTGWLELASDALDYISHNISDPVNGEWHWSIRDDGSVNLEDDKAGFWKCPYHNTRMCLEVLAMQQF